MPLTPGSFVACRSTASASARFILSSAAPSGAAPRRVTFQQAFAFFSDMLRCELAVAPDQFSGTRHPGQPPLRPHRLKSALRRVGPRYSVFHQHFSRGARYHLRGPLHSDLNVECIVTAIQRPWNGSHSEYSVRVPSLRLSAFN